MNCPYCGSPIPPNTTSCPACGAKCESSLAPAASSPAPEAKQSLTPEQLAFYAAKEEKCRREMKAAKKWMIVIPIICLVPGFFLMIMAGVWVWFLLGGIGIVGVILEAVAYAVNASELEKTQQKILFGEK